MLRIPIQLRVHLCHGNAIRIVEMGHHESLPHDRKLPELTLLLREPVEIESLTDELKPFAEIHLQSPAKSVLEETIQAGDAAQRDISTESNTMTVEMSETIPRIEPE